MVDVIYERPLWNIVQYIENINPSDAVAALDLERRPKCIPNGLLCDKPYKNIW